MDTHWYSSIHEDLEKVESIMNETVRSENPKLTEICRYVLNSNGKRIRPAICILTFKACGGKDTSGAIKIGTALEVIHNATLVHDDINDQGELRRGAKAAYKQFSISKSIIAGDFLFVMGFQFIRSVSLEIVDYIIEAATSMSAGEFDQKDFEHNTAASEEIYMKIIEGKTARLIESGAKSGALLAGAKIETIDRVGEFAHNVGMAFQIIDDTLDIIGDEKITGKRTGSDIMEGKPTLPIIFAMEDPKHGNRIRQIFEMEVPEWSDISEAVDLIKKTDSIPRCKEKAKSIVNHAKVFLNDLDESEYKTALIEMADYIASRDR